MKLNEGILSLILSLSKTLNKYYNYLPYLSLLLGILTILLWQRSFEFIRWAFIYLVIIGSTTIILLRFFKSAAHDSKILSALIWCAEFINQNLYQDLLLFLLPIYYQSSTVYSKNIILLIVIAALAVIITTFDNIYRTLILKNRITQFLFYTLTLFLFLNFCLPVIFGIRNIYSLYISITLSIILLAPLAIDYKELKKAKVAAAALIILISLLVVNLFKGFIPPVPLKLISGTAGTEINRIKKKPVNTFTVISLKEVDSVYCYTSIFAPMGIHERLWHIWEKDGIIMQRIPLDITGGRKEGFRTWSKRTIAGNQDIGNPKSDLGFWGN